MEHSAISSVPHLRICLTTGSKQKAQLVPVFYEATVLQNIEDTKCESHALKDVNPVIQQYKAKTNKETSKTLE